MTDVSAQTAAQRLQDAREHIEAARTMVAELCSGTRRWALSIPARPDYDPDLVIARGLDAGRDAIGRAEAAEARVRELEEALREPYDALHDWRQRAADAFDNLDALLAGEGAEAP